MKVVFMASGQFALPTLKILAASGMSPSLVVTQPAQPAGRGGKLRATPVAECASELGLEVVESENVNAPAMVERLAALAVDAIVVVDFGQMVRDAIRQTAKLGVFNIHASLLPALRGAAPINWAIINGLTTTGVTTFRLVDKLDAGPIYVQLRTEIRADETADELKRRLAELGAAAAIDTLKMLERGQTPTDQDESATTLAPKMSKSDGLLDFAGSAEDMSRRIRGCWPWPGGRATLLSHGRELAVTIARATFAAADASGKTAGEVDVDGAVACGTGTLKILEIQPSGKRLMAWRDFANGHRIAVGDRFVKVKQ